MALQLGKNTWEQKLAISSLTVCTGTASDPQIFVHGCVAVCDSGSADCRLGWDGLLQIIFLCLLNCLLDLM